MICAINKMALTACLLLSMTAHAGYDECKAAYDKKDFETALKACLPLAKHGNATAQFNVGSIYVFGWGVPQDDKKAVKWYRLAADQGHASAQTYLAVMYANGQGVPKDYKKAVKWYRLAADQGDASAQFNLGVMYTNGLGVPEDYNEAVKLYRLAADQGYAPAQTELGVMYDKVWGVAKVVRADQQPMDYSQFEYTRTATISAFREFLEYKYKIHSALDREEIYESTYLERRISHFGQVDVKSIDPILTEFFQTLENEFSETLHFLRQSEQEYTNLSESLNGPNHMMNDPSENLDTVDDKTSTIFTSAINTQVKENYYAQWRPEILRISSKYDATEKQQLQKLSKKYHYSFYSIVFGKS